MNELNEKTTLPIHGVMRCFIYDDESRCYYYGIDAWGNMQWGNDKDKAKKYGATQAERVAIMFDREDRKVWIGVF